MNTFKINVNNTLFYIFDTSKLLYFIIIPTAELVEEDPLQYDKFDNKKSYLGNIDFSKTHFHNPLVIKHDHDNDYLENGNEI